MEIHIQLAGVQLGPYSDKQVREYIAEGLLSMADKARIDGSLDWIPVSELVEKLPPPPTPAPPPKPDAVFVDAEPLAPQTSGSPAAAPAPAEEPVIESQVAPEAAPAIFESPAPKADAGILPPRKFDPFTAKTKPLAPPTMASTGSVKTQPLGPRPPASVAKTKGVTASRGVSTTAPLEQATKKMSRTALARALTNKTEPLPARTTVQIHRAPPASSPGAEPPAEAPTELPAVAASAPETTGPMASGVTTPTAPPPAEAKKGGGLPSLLKSLTAKTVPMRRAVPAPDADEEVEAPPAPPGGSSSGRTTMPVTTPLPTRAIMNPATAASRSSRPASPPPAAPPVQPSAAPPAPEMDAPTEILPVSKRAAELRAKAEKRAAERLAAEAPLEAEVKTQPLARGKIKAETKPVAMPDAKAKTDVESKTDAESAAEPAAAAKAAPRPKRRQPLLLVVCGVVAAIGAYYVWSPYHASAALRDAMADASVAGLEKRVDFDALRASLKQQAQLLAKGADSSAAADASGIVGKSIDSYITADGIAYLASKNRASDEKFSYDTVSVLTPDVAANLIGAFIAQPVRHQGLSSPTDFVLQTDVGNMHLSLEGIHWKLTRIDLNSNSVAVPGDSGGAPLAFVPVVQSYLQRGHQASDAALWPAAISDFTHALALAPQSSGAYDARAQAHLSKGDFDDAIKDFTQAITIDPVAAAAYNGRGSAQLGKGNLDAAITDYTQALKLDPTLADALDNRGNAKSAKNDLAGAIQDFTQAITIDPTLAKAFNDRGLARQANGNLDGAIKDYTDALGLKPNNARIYFSRGLARLSQANLPAAILDFDHALSIDPKIADAWFQRGNAKSALHHTDEAISDFTQGLALDPKNALAYCSRGVAREDKGDLDGAQADYTQALKLDPKIAVAYFRRALIEVRRGNPDGAIADTTQSLALDPKTTQAYYYRGFAKLLRGDLVGASSDFQLFCESTPHDRFADNARLYVWLIAKLSNAHGDADQDLSDALENSWNNSADDFTAKTAAFLLGRVTESDYLTAATSNDANVDATLHCQAWYFAGMKRLIMGDKGTAADYFQKCLATGKKDFCEYILAQAQLQTLQPALAPAPDATAPGVAPAPAPPVPKTP
jgi:tetratricopeptide (TPR) repeat protein